jgi:tetratricopeptide (TPR) repeat protein/DNA-binding CsgD family transcriptional regulator
MAKSKKTVKKLTIKEKQERIDEIHAFTIQHKTTQPQKTVELLSEAMELCRDIDNIPMLILSMTRKAVGLRMMLLLDEALALLEEALNVATTHNLEKDQAIIYSNIAIVYYQRGDYQKSKTYYGKSADIFERKEMYRNQIFNLSDMAAISIGTNEYAEGFSYCQRAFVLCDIHKIFPYPVVLLNNTALIYINTGNMEKAVYYYNATYNVALEAGNLREQSMALHNIAVCYYNNKELDMALQCSLRSIETHKDIDIPAEKQKFYLLKAQILFKLLKKEESYQCLEQAWKICEDKTLPEQKIVYLQCKAEFLIKENNFIEAEICLEKALALARKHQMQSSVISSYQLKGKIPPLGNQIESLLTALHLSETHMIKQVHPDIHHELSVLYESAGDTEKSLTHFKKFYELKEKIQAEKHLRQMEIANMQHDAEKAQQEAALLKVEKEFMEKEIASNKQQLEEITRDVIEKNQLLATIKNKLGEAMLQQGLKQKTTLSEIINITQHGATSLWLQLEERAASVGGNLTKKLLHLCPELTTVELRILVLLQRGMSNKEISHVLFITERTVQYYRTGIRKKLRLEKEESLLAFLNCL